MAQRVLLGHPRPQLAQLARAIIDGQSREMGRWRPTARSRSGGSPRTAGSP